MNIKPWDIIIIYGEAGRVSTRVSADALSALEGLLARRGPCLVLAGIYLSLAERLGVTAVPVATPRHVFIEGAEFPGATGPGASGNDTTPGRNIELLERGAERSDASYLSQEKAPGDDPRAAQLLRVLAPRAFLAYLLNNHAVTLRAQGDVKEAGRTYKRALRLDTDCQPCHFNFANLLAAQGRRDAPSATTTARWRCTRGMRRRGGNGRVSVFDPEPPAGRRHLPVDALRRAA